ncbi:hypothetical protein [Microbispora catharanthi]|uniref:hypothetical protein n=1 Tax=Microbispora catharanthi TaxID=1712871 RepID=UPI00197CB0CB|nr:hypothetical protein [Microbispora catharanthi]
MLWQDRQLRQDSPGTCDKSWLLDELSYGRDLAHERRDLGGIGGMLPRGLAALDRGFDGRARGERLGGAALRVETRGILRRRLADDASEDEEAAVGVPRP